MDFLDKKSGSLLVQNAGTVFGGLYAYLKNLNFSSFHMMPKFFAVILGFGGKWTAAVYTYIVTTRDPALIESK